MRLIGAIHHPGVILLTLSCSVLLSACSLIGEHYAETCNSRAYTRNILSDYITSRFPSNAPVRMAIIPFSVAANVSTYGDERPGLGNILSWKVHQYILASQTIPIVEVLNRQDWPGKKEEFFTGNFGAISRAREAGYDLVLIGYLESLKSMDTMTAYTKVIDVESGITLWYGQSTSSTYRPDIKRARYGLRLEPSRPDMLFTDDLVGGLAQCIAAAVTSEEEEL